MKRSMTCTLIAIVATSCIIVFLLLLGLGGCVNQMLPGHDMLPRVDGSPYASFSMVQLDGYIELDGNLSWDEDGYIKAWRWDFGDGHFSDEPYVGHVYYVEEEFLLRLTVTDNEGLQSDTVLTVRPTPNPGDPGGGGPPHVPDQPTPDASFSWEQGHGVGEEVAFDGRKTTADGEITRGRWDYGDGTHSSGRWVRYEDGERFSVNRETTHTYDEPGNYEATLTVWDEDGNSSTTSHLVVIH